MPRFNRICATLVVITPCLAWNIPATDSLTGAPMLVGRCDRQGLEQEPYRDWFRSEYDNYVPDSTILPVLELLMPAAEIRLVVFLGTWCSDSRREVPRLLKIVDVLGFPDSGVALIGVDRSKHSPDGSEQGLRIHHVPTLIVLKAGVEIGRIIESPLESLEADLEQILAEEDYQPNYYELEP